MLILYSPTTRSGPTVRDTVCILASWGLLAKNDIVTAVDPVPVRLREDEMVSIKGSQFFASNAASHLGLNEK